MKSHWKNKNVLVTGVTGFIGGNLVKGLLDEGANVFGLVRNRKPKTFLEVEGLLERITLIEGELTDFELLSRVVTEEQIDSVFHLAAQVEVGVAAAHPLLTWETNIRGTYMLLEAIRLYGKQVRSIVIASSDKAYGSYPKEKMPYQEDYPLIPQFPYDTSKACADMVARAYSSSLYKMPIVVTRFCNIYGPGQLNFSAVIPDACQSALGYSDFFPRGTGQQIRDFIYAGDVVSLYLTIGEALANKPELGGEVFNAGTNEPRKIRELVERLYKLAGAETRYHDTVERRWKSEEAAGEIDCQFMDYKKVEKYFGWKPQTSFDSGLQATLAWFKRYLAETRTPV